MMIRNEKGQLIREEFPAFTLTTACVSIINDIGWVDGRPIYSFFDPPRYKCEYCDTLYFKPGNCKNCGAPISFIKD